jgi:cytochrome c oxidase subunit 2
VSHEPRDHSRRKSLRRLAGWALAAGLLLASLAGCGKQSIISNRSPQAHNITLLWWWMLAAAVIVFLGAIAMLAIAWFKRGVAGLPFVGERESVTESLVLVFGIAIPIVALVALFGASDVYLIRQTAPPIPRSTAITIDVIGHQWWWEVRYRRAGSPSYAVTANEIHIPVDTRVDVVATTADVIHSFWVPALNRKIDMVPGRQNRVLLYATSAGTYRGQCSQFCGFQHANMSLYVFAQRPAAYRAWLAGMEAPASASASGAAGQRLFMSSQCASCHRIAGTAARGTVGPDLTHVASRTTIASLTLPNTPAQLAAWIRNPQAIKPGARMPDLGLSQAEVSDLVAYLETLH